MSPETDGWYTEWIGDLLRASEEVPAKGSCSSKSLVCIWQSKDLNPGFQQAE